MSRPTATSRRSVKTEYIETDTGNKISRRAHIEGKQNIMLGASIISTGTTLHPPSRLHHGKLTYYPMRIADNVFIGANSQISSASISSHVHIGENCVLGPFSMIKEGCKVLPNTVVPANMMIPPGSVVAGRPARIVGEVGDGWGQVGSGEVEIVEGGDLKGLVRTIK
ncbi:uncharacterized protein MYCGRDRAFT_90228 [Zymoseptoria tritici IPO323]|uniref:Dynactin subunit 5 n=1 Tax=Zymoseptoria tritici (strain CBS 115943 / IPO323) TaxID=336722 RepID=F9X1L2_ZYMTI|nr:uncharacterized protein MYCGRDRAFT_90228 [Zymoseptoria tritici IPO323]EGP91867.1 hypothetical protein MYCGRDRAFT_90228 [Zymoseptoria tritici IPO323]